MARLVTKFKYLKSDQEKPIGGYATYIATREGVEKIDESFKLAAATVKQQKLIEKILRDFPDSAAMLEYEDYQREKTVGAASEFITRAIEDNAHEILNQKTYVDYIGTCPGAERFGSHGLFTDDGVQVKLKEVSQELNAHQGNVWTLIISLRREDAERLGFNTGVRWRDMLRTQTQALADSLKIPMDHLKWYAAFHNESHHPHVHLLAYSTVENEGFLTKQGVEEPAQADAPDPEMPEAPESDSQTDDPIEPDPPPGYRSYSGGWGWKKDTWWTNEYKAARAFLYGTRTSKPDFEQALTRLKEEALRGNGFAMHDLGKMILAGLGCEKNEEQAQEWFRKAFSAFCAREPKRKSQGTSDTGLERCMLSAMVWIRMKKKHFLSLPWRPQMRANRMPMLSMSWAGCAGLGLVPHRIRRHQSNGTKQAYQGFLEIEQNMADDKLYYRLGQMNLTGICRGIEHIGRDLHRRFAFERQHLGGRLAAKHQGGGKGEILHTACKIEIYNGQLISLHRDALLKLPGDILMAGRQRDKGCNQQHHRKSIKNCGKDRPPFRGLRNWIAVHLHHLAPSAYPPSGHGIAGRPFAAFG